MKPLLASLSFTFLCLILILSTETWSQSTAQTPLKEVIRPATDTLNEGAWNRDGELLAVAINNSIYVYDRELTEVAILNGHTDLVTSVDWNSDSSQLASVSYDRTIRIWDMEAGADFGTELVVLTGHTDPIFRVRWSPDDTMLATVMFDSKMTDHYQQDPFYTTWVWALFTGTVKYMLPSLTHSTVLEWSPDSDFIINSGVEPFWGGGVKFWSMDSGLEEYYIRVAPFAITSSIALHPTGNFLATTTTMGIIDIADLTQSEFYPSINRSRYAMYSGIYEGGMYRGLLSWESTGQLLAIGDVAGNIFVFDFATTQPVFRNDNAHQGEIISIGWNPEYPLLFSIGNEDNAIRLWDVSGMPDLTGTATATPRYDLTPTATP